MWPDLYDFWGVKLTVWGLGLAVAFVLGCFIWWHRLREDYSGEDLLSLWLWLVVVIFLSALSSFIPARNASRMTVREVLAYE